MLCSKYFVVCGEKLLVLILACIFSLDAMSIAAPENHVYFYYPNSVDALRVCNQNAQAHGVSCSPWAGPQYYFYVGASDYEENHYYLSSGCPTGLYDNGSGGACVPNEEEQGSACTTGGTNPINLGVGNKYQIETDFFGGGSFPLEVSRTFNSLNGRWQQLREIMPKVGFTEALVIRPDGKGFTFTSAGAGEWTSDPGVTGALESFEDTSGNITSWRYTTLDQQVEDYDASGQLTAITHRSGITHTYTNTSTDITVTHSEGGTLIYQLNTEGRVTGFTDPDSNPYTYGYDAEGRLTGITYPNGGGTRLYHYEEARSPKVLTGITDANGDRFATWAYDTVGRAVSSEHNSGSDKVIIDYTYIDDATDPRTIATNPLGKQTTYHFTTIHGVRKVTQVEGHQSNNCAAANKAYTYDTNGFLETKTDWQGNVTRYTRNTKGQELTRIEAENTPEQRTITTDWHATFNVPTKITKSDRETTFTYDTNGNQETRVVMEIP